MSNICQAYVATRPSTEKITQGLEHVADGHRPILRELVCLVGTGYETMKGKSIVCTYV